MKTSNKKLSVKAVSRCTAALFLLIPAAVYGQTAANEDSDTDTLIAPNEIVVTAQKRSQRLQDVPASVSVLDADEMTKEGLVRFEDYAAKVPGLSITSGRTGQTQVTLRGITTGAVQSASATAFYIDEAPIGSVNAYTRGALSTPDLDPSDLAQIEVLKGPQGTLYGAGAVGGLVKFVTVAPDLANFEGRVSTGATMVDGGGTGYSGRAMITLPLEADELALHVSGFYRKDPGYIDNINTVVGRDDINEATVKGGRAMLAMRLGPDVRLDVSAILQDTTTQGSNSVDVDAVTLKPIAGEREQARFARERGFVQFRLYNATLRAGLGEVDLLSSTTYQLTKTDIQSDASRSFGAALGGIGVIANSVTSSHRFSQELRASTEAMMDGLLDLQAGLYYTHEDDINSVPGFDTFNRATGAPLAFPNIIQAVIDTSYEEYSVFGNGTVHLGSKFDILAGIRFSHDNQDYFQDYSGLLVGPRRINVGASKSDVVTYLVSPQYRISPDAMVYGRVASGYRPGGPNAVPPPSVVVAPDTFDPDKLTQYEVGIKASLLNRIMTIDAAAFYTDWSDIQIQTSAAGFNFFVNGGNAKSQGGEVSVILAPSDGLSFSATGAYTDATLTTDAPAAGGLDGDRLPYVPRWSGSLSAEYSFPLGETSKAYFGGSANYIGDRRSDYSNRFPKMLPSYTTFSLRGGVEFGELSLSVFAKNLTDERGFLSVSALGLAPSNTPGAVYGASLIQPRTFGAEVAMRF